MHYVVNARNVDFCAVDFISWRRNEAKRQFELFSSSYVTSVKKIAFIQLSNMCVCLCLQTDQECSIKLERRRIILIHI